MVDTAVLDAGVISPVQRTVVKALMGERRANPSGIGLSANEIATKTNLHLSTVRLALTYRMDFSLENLEVVRRVSVADVLREILPSRGLRPHESLFALTLSDDEINKHILLADAARQ